VATTGVKLKRCRSHALAGSRHRTRERDGDQSQSEVEASGEPPPYTGGRTSRRTGRSPPGVVAAKATLETVFGSPKAIPRTRVAREPDQLLGFRRSVVQMRDGVASEDLVVRIQVDERVDREGGRPGRRRELSAAKVPPPRRGPPPRSAWRPRGARARRSRSPGRRRPARARADVPEAVDVPEPRGPVPEVGRSLPDRAPEAASVAASSAGSNSSRVYWTR